MNEVTSRPEQEREPRRGAPPSPEGAQIEPSPEPSPEPAPAPSPESTHEHTGADDAHTDDAHTEDAHTDDAHTGGDGADPSRNPPTDDTVESQPTIRDGEGPPKIPRVQFYAAPEPGARPGSVGGATTMVSAEDLEWLRHDHDSASSQPELRTEPLQTEPLQTEPLQTDPLQTDPTGGAGDTRTRQDHHDGVEHDVMKQAVLQESAIEESAIQNDALGRDPAPDRTSDRTSSRADHTDPSDADDSGPGGSKMGDPNDSPTRAELLPSAPNSSANEDSAEHDPDSKPAATQHPEVEPLPARMQKSWEIVTEYPDAALAVPIIASSLEETLLARRAVDALLASLETRAPREIVRRFHFLIDSLRQYACQRGEARLLIAARQLLRSDHVATRLNVVLLAQILFEQGSARRADVLGLLLQLIDDPSPRVRAPARQLFLDQLAANPREVAGRSRQDPVLNALTRLLENFEHHGDERVIQVLLGLGERGADLLGRAIGEQWPPADRILETVRALSWEELGTRADSASEQLLDNCLDSILRWLRSPFPATREGARTLLRDHSHPPFVRCLVRRLRSDEVREYPVFRHIRWDCLPESDLAQLEPHLVQRLAQYLRASSDSPQERLQRIGKLLRCTDSAARLPLLELLENQDVAPIVGDLARCIADPIERVQLLATELIAPRGGRQSFMLLVQAMRSQFATVRDAAQKKISGSSLTYLLESQAADGVVSDELLSLLRKLDLRFDQQLARVLRERDEITVIKALRVVMALGELLTHSDEAPLRDRHGVQESLFDLTVHPNPKVRATLARALRFADRETTLRYLRLFLADPDTRVVANAVETLGDIADSRTRSWLQPLREHTTPRVRANALRALHGLGDADAKDELRQLAQPDQASPFRISASWALKDLISS